MVGPPLLESFVNIFLLVVMGVIALIGPFVGGPFQYISDSLHSLYKRPSNPHDEGDKHNVRTHPLSAVNAETPDIHHDYLKEDEHDKTGGTDLTRREFDLNNALLFIHLCALVYEDTCILDYVLQQWHLECESILSAEGKAWIIYHSTSTCPDRKTHACRRNSKDGRQDFIAVVFKGTSPFDFVEWMVDFTMSKVSPHDELLCRAWFMRFVASNSAHAVVTHIL